MITGNDGKQSLQFTGAMQTTFGVMEKVLPTLIENPITSNRLKQITDTFLLSVMKENILTQNNFEPVICDIAKRGFYPTILGWMEVSADRKIISTIE